MQLKKPILILIILVVLAATTTASTTLSGCTTISASGVYILNTPITNYANTCFTITASDVELDCQGNTIDGSTTAGTYGIFLDGTPASKLQNVTIRNCNVNNFDNGYRFEYVVDSSVYESSATNANKYGFYLYWSDYNSFNNITATGQLDTNDAGVYIYYSNKYNNFTGGTISNNYYGINYYDAYTDGEFNRFTRLNISNNIKYGLYFSSTYSDSNYIYDNYFNNDNNAYSYIGADNYWNTSKTSGTNIMGGSAICGNYWADWTGPDSTGEGISYAGYLMYGYEVDYCPIVNNNNKGDITTCSGFAWPGTFYLDANITDSPYTCFTIESNDVELDCKGHTVDGQTTANTYGIFLDGAPASKLQNVTIKNCNVNNFDFGYNFDYVVNSFVYSSSATNANKYGFYLYWSDYNSFNNISATGQLDTNDAGVYIYYSNKYNNFTGGTISNNYYGINHYDAYTDGEFNRFTRLNISDNTKYGIYFANTWSDSNYIYDNYFNNDNNAYSYIGADNYWNTSKTSGTNIMGGSAICGNYWADWTGPDSTGEGISYAGYLMYGYEVDYCPVVDNNNKGDLTTCSAFAFPGTFYLGADITDSPYTCFTIESNDVELDCKGHTVDGQTTTNTYGIFVDGPTAKLQNVTIRNCNVNNFDFGYNFDYVVNSFVYSSSATNANKYGFYLYWSDYNSFNNITATGQLDTNDAGVYIYYSNKYNNFTGGTISNNYYGINYYDAYTSGEYNRFTRLNISDNTKYGIYFSSTYSDSNYIYDNYFNNDNNAYSYSGADNYWNTSKTSGTNIMGGSAICGNYWTDWTGPDSTGEGISYAGYLMYGYEVDYCPVVNNNNKGDLTTCSAFAQPGTFYLGTDITDSPYTCFTIESNDVELDCKGHTVDGQTTTNTYGIFVDGPTAKLQNVTIRNCNVNNFDFGYNFDYMVNSSVYNSSATNANKYGFYLYWSDYNSFNNITATGQLDTNDAGVYIYYSNKYNNFTGGTISNNYYGINYYDAYTPTNENNRFTRLNISDNTKYGLYFSSTYSDGSYVYDNYFNNDNNAYSLSGADNYWNIPKTSGTNIIGGLYIGGNFWATPTGTGFSENCIDSDNDGVCDGPYDMGGGEIDYFPTYYSTIYINNAPNDPSPSLVSVDGSNLTSADLNCSSIISDNDNDAMNVTVIWFKDGILDLTVDYNNSYASGTEFYAILGSGNTSAKETWICSLRLFDGLAYSEWINSSDLTIIEVTPPVATGPILYYNFDEGQGDIVYDSSVNGNDGVVYGGTWTTGKIGGALEFDGVDDYIRADDHPSLDVEDLTIEGWFKFKALDSLNGGIGKGRVFGATDEFAYIIDFSNDIVSFKATKTGGASNLFTLTSHISQANQWYHIAGTWSNTSKIATLYVNGNNVNSTTVPSGSIWKFSHPFCIGARCDQSLYSINGFIDEVKIYDRVLLQEEINQNYDIVITPSGPKKKAAGFKPNLITILIIIFILSLLAVYDVRYRE